jgi:hypothetical protein
MGGDWPMSIHRRRTSYVATNLWTPAQLSNNELWLEADDASTLTLVSDSVSEWRDKSGNDRHATQSTESLRPGYLASEINGNPAIDFDGTNDSLTISNSTTLLQFDNTYSKAFVIKPDVVSNSPVIIHQPAGPWSHLVELNSSSSNAGLYWGDNSGNFRTYAENTNFAVAGTTTFFILIKISESTGDAYLSGSLITSFTGSLAATPTGGINWILGSYSDSSLNYNGKIGEVLISSQAWDTTNRQLVEGYFAHKYGLTGSLPNDHPYKNSAPNV